MCYGATESHKRARHGRVVEQAFDKRRRRTKMKAKYFLLGLLLSPVALPTIADAKVSTTLFAFGDSDTGPNVTATKKGNITTITSTNTSVPIESYQWELSE